MTVVVYDHIDDNTVIINGDEFVRVPAKDIRVGDIIIGLDIPWSIDNPLITLAQIRDVSHKYEFDEDAYYILLGHYPSSVDIAIFKAKYLLESRQDWEFVYFYMKDSFKVWVLN